MPEEDYDSLFDDEHRQSMKQTLNLMIQEMHERVSYDIWHKPLKEHFTSTSSYDHTCSSTGLFSSMWNKLRFRSKLKNFSRKCKQMKLL